MVLSPQPPVPDLGNTYADVIAFLVPRGELEEALDAYHRALGRSEVIDYLKVYCSLWIIDLAHRASPIVARSFCRCLPWDQSSVPFSNRAGLLHRAKNRAHKCRRSNDGF